LTLAGLLALAGCSGNPAPAPSATPLGDKTGMSVKAEEMPQVQAEEGLTPTVTYPLKEGAESPTPTPPEDEAPIAPPEEGDEAPPEESPTPEPPSPYIDPPTSLQVQVQGDEGDGDVVGENDLVSVAFVAWSWGETEPLGGFNSWGTRQTMVFPLGTQGPVLALSRVVVGQKVGSKLLAVVPPGLAELNTTLGAEAGTTSVIYMELIEKFAKDLQAQDDAKPTDETVGPQIDGALGHEAKVSVPGGVEPPEEFTVQVLATGTGDEVAAGDQVLVHYAAVDWNGVDGGSTWQDGQGPTPIVVPSDAGETVTVFAGLVGLPVGSRVLVTTPAKERAFAAQAVVIDLVALPAPVPGLPEVPGDAISLDLEP